MPVVRELLSCLWDYAPRTLKLDFDNVGLLAGRDDRAVTRVLVCLDITSQTVAEAATLGAQLIVSHHPLLFDLKQVTAETAPALVALLEHGMSAICMHTNLDAAAGGVNDALADALALRDTVSEAQDEQGRGVGFVRVGTTDPCSVRDFAARVRAALAAPHVQFADGGHPVRRVGLCSGSGMSELDAALRLGCDTFVTGEAKHSAWLEARERGVNLVVAGHHATEAVVLPRVAAALRAAFPEITVTLSQTQRSPYEVL